MGLLCLRLGAGVALFHDGITGWVGSPQQQYLLRLAIDAAAGLLLFAGLWTPLAGGVTAIMGLWATFFGPGDPWGEVQLAILGAGLGLLGPGAWSVDAHLFGRKRIRIPDR